MVEAAVIISIIALVLAYFAFAKGEGLVGEVKLKFEDMNAARETFRSKTADMLVSLGEKIRG